MKNILAIIIVGLTLFSCKENSSTNTVTKDLDTGQSTEDRGQHVVHIEPCKICDSIFKVFPKDSISFERLYGYPSGSRQYEVQEDFIEYFNCLEKCFDFRILNQVTKLGSSIKFDADGPTFLRHYLTTFLMNNKDKASELYSKIECKGFVQHVAFLYVGVENTDFTDRLCKYLSSIELKEVCKAEVVKEYCERDFSNDHH